MADKENIYKEKKKGKKEMKKIIAVLLTAIMGISLLTGCGGTNTGGDTQQETENNTQTEVGLQPGELMTPADAFAGGDGTKENPYQISNAAEWYRFSYVANGNLALEDEDYAVVFREKYYVLTNDIVINDVSDFENWSAKAPKYDWNPIHGFEGHLDGQGHTITGFYCSDLWDEGVTGAGIFSYIYVGGVVENLKMEKAMIVTTSPASNAGVIAGSVSEGEIRNCEVSGMVTGTGMAMGGITGTASWSVIEKCNFTGEVYATGQGNFGGIVGSASGVITDCTNAGTITSDDIASVGGIAGSFEAASMGFMLDEETYPEEAAKVESIITSVKGLGVGIKNCTNTGDVTAALYEAGGIVGHLSDGLGYNYLDLMVIENCVNEGNVTAKDTNWLSGNAGGICGVYATESAILEENRVVGSLVFKNCVNKGDILASGGNVAGVLAAATMQWGALTVDSCSNLGTLTMEETGGAHMSGFVGTVSAFEGVELRFENLTDETTYNVIKNCTAGGIVGSVVSAQSNEGELTFIMKNCKGLGTYTIENPDEILAGMYGALCGHFLEGIYVDDFQGTFEVIDCQIPEGVPAVAQDGSFFDKVNVLIEIIKEEQEQAQEQQGQE